MIATAPLRRGRPRGQTAHGLLCNSDRGVYMLVSRKNGASYIGASTNLKGRLAHHRSACRGKKMANGWSQAMRSAFADHKWESDIEVRILERVDLAGGKKHLHDRERHWIASLMPTTNLNDLPPVEEVVLPPGLPNDVELPDNFPEPEQPVHLFKVYDDSADDGIEVRAFTWQDAAMAACSQRNWKQENVIVRYLRTVKPI